MKKRKFAAGIVPLRFYWEIAGVKAAWFLIFAGLFGAFQICKGERTMPPEALSLAHWIVSQQYANAKLPSYGALKISPEPAVDTTNGVFCRVSPYFANLAVLSLLRAQAPEARQTGERWIDWYLAHLDAQAAPDGVPDEHFYHKDGTGETTCAKPNDHFLCHYNDATDSAAATFFSVLWAENRGDAAREKFIKRKGQIEHLATVLLKLQQPDGLCWAKMDYRVKYLEDNCEVFAGLRDLANLERETFRDSERADVYHTASERVRQGILTELYDSRSQLFRVAKFEPPNPSAVNLDKWYPDCQAQYWPILFGVLLPADSRARAIISLIDAHWNGHTRPNWPDHPEQINGGWIESADAYGALLAGDGDRVRVYMGSVARLKLDNQGGLQNVSQPFTAADAGWLLQIFARLPN